MSRVASRIAKKAPGKTLAKHRSTRTRLTSDPGLLQLYRHVCSTPFGPFAVATDADGAVRYCNWTSHEAHTLEELQQRWYKHTRLQTAPGSAATPGHEAAEAIAKFFGASPGTSPATLNALLDAVPVLYPPTAPPFTKAVWEVCRATVPAGEFLSYGELADRVRHILQRSTATERPTGEDRPKSSLASRAVGQAMSRNPIVVVMPCHRVLAASKGLNGYGPGLRLKVWLLRHESAPVPAEKLQRVEWETQRITKASRA